MTSTNRIPIGFAITELDPGGAERALVQIVTRLDQSRWDPFVYCLSGEGELAETLQSADIPVRLLHARGKWDFGLTGRLAKLLRQDSIQLLQTFLHHANIAGRLAARKAGIPIVVSGIRVAEERSRWRLRVDRWTQHWVDMNVCVSESVQKFSKEVGRISPEKLCTIRNGVNFEQFDQAQPFDWTVIGLPESARVILVVGRLDDQKRPCLALKSSLPLLKQSKDLCLIFAGIGPDQEKILRIAEEESLSDRVFCLGTRNDVPELMKASKLLLHVSAWEGSPNVLLEAIASGLPIVATDTPGNRDALGESGLGLMTSDSVESIRSSIVNVLESPQLLIEQDQTSCDSVRQSQSWEKTVSSYEHLYLELLNRL